MHTNASSAIKFNGLVSENFNILQGDRQGGILSADLYKIYIDPLLKQLQQSRLGMHIGYIECGATACADDITLNCMIQLKPKSCSTWHIIIVVLNSINSNRKRAWSYKWKAEKKVDSTQ